MWSGLNPAPREEHCVRSQRENAMGKSVFVRAHFGILKRVERLTPQWKLNEINMIRRLHNCLT